MSEKEEPFDLRSRAGLGEHKTPPSVIHTVGEKKGSKKMKKSTDFSVLKRQAPLLCYDSCTWSTSYKGFSGRADILCMLALRSLCSALGGMLLYIALETLENAESDISIARLERIIEFALFCYYLIVAALNILYYWPCVIRRSRQLSGNGTYGWALNIMDLFIGLLLLSTGWNIYFLISYFILVPFMCLMILCSIPLFIIKGSYAGAKNELMRAAIEGDMARVKKLVARRIYNLELKSEMGYTAREYAEKRGHEEIAAYLKEMEELQTSPQGVHEDHSVKSQSASVPVESMAGAASNEAAVSIVPPVTAAPFTAESSLPLPSSSPSSEEPSSSEPLVLPTINEPPLPDTSLSPTGKEMTSPEVPISNAPSPGEPKKTGWIWLLVAILVIASLILGASYIRACSENAVQKPLMTEFQSNIRTLERENAVLQTQVQAVQEETNKLRTQLRERDAEQEAISTLRDENTQLQKRLEEVSAECAERNETVERLRAALVESDKEKEGLRKRVAEPSAEPNKGAATSTTTAGDAAEMDGILFKNYPYTIFRIKAAQPMTNVYSDSVIVRFERDTGKAEAQLICYDADGKPQVLDSYAGKFERYTKLSDMHEDFGMEEDAFNQAKFHYQGPAHIHVVGMGEVSLNEAGNPVRTVKLIESGYVRVEGLNLRPYMFASTGTIEGCHSLDGGSGVGDGLKGSNEEQNPDQPSAIDVSRKELAIKAQSIVVRFIESQSSDGGDVGYEELHYPVSFLEYGLQDRAFVMSDRQEYKAKFPKRRFTWDDITVTEVEKGKEWHVTAQYHCIVQSAKGKWIGCEMKGVYILRDYPGEGVRINSLTEDLVRRYTPTDTEISAAFNQEPQTSAQQSATVKDGSALVPANAPQRIARAIAAGNKIINKPYREGGGHNGKHNDSGYDSSGAIAFVLREAGMLQPGSDPSPADFLRWGRPGFGKWLTVYVKGEHVFLMIAGLRFDVSDGTRMVGPRWYTEPCSSGGYSVRHVPGF